MRQTGQNDDVKMHKIKPTFVVVISFATQLSAQAMGRVRLMYVYVHLFLVFVLNRVRN